MRVREAGREGGRDERERAEREGERERELERARESERVKRTRGQTESEHGERATRGLGVRGDAVNCYQRMPRGTLLGTYFTGLPAGPPSSISGALQSEWTTARASPRTKGTDLEVPGQCECELCY